MSKETELLKILSEVPDPEVPVLSIIDLGIVRGCRISEGTVHIDVTPTYSGCPAMKSIEEDIIRTINLHGYDSVKVHMVFSPPWTTEWMSESGKKKLKEYGIAPPDHVKEEPLIQFPGRKTEKVVECPFCNSKETETKSQFGSTACKSLHYCRSCHQPFEHFKAF